MYRFSDHSKEAKKYRLRQWIANSAISGRDMREDDIALLENGSTKKYRKTSAYGD